MAVEVNAGTEIAAVVGVVDDRLVEAAVVELKFSRGGGGALTMAERNV